MIEIPQTNLILRKEDNVSGMPVSDTTFGTQGNHCGVDGLEGMDILLLLQLFHQPVHN